MYALKYTGSVIAALYGLYATLTDFRRQEGQEKVLTAKGYFGIALLLVSSVLAISADAYKDRLEEKEKQHQKTDDDRAKQAMVDKLQSEIDKTDGIAKQLTFQTERILEPIKDPMVSYEVLVPTDSDEIKELVKETKIYPKPVQVPGGKFLCPGTTIEPSKANKYPSAGDAFDSLVLYMAFYREPIPAQLKLQTLSERYPPGYAFEIPTHVSAQPGEGNHLILYDLHKRLRLSVLNKRLDPTAPPSTTYDISSVPDLLNSSVLITIEPQDGQVYAEGFAPPGRKLRRRFQIYNLQLKLFGKREPFVLDVKRVKPLVNELGYLVDYGKFSEIFHPGPSPFGPQDKCE